MTHRNRDEAFLTLEDLTEMGSVIDGSILTEGLDTIKPEPGRPKKRKRRLKHASDEILRRFRCQRNLKHPPKKEYIRCAMIRAHKKAVRQLKTLQEGQDLWNAFHQASQSPIVHELAQTKKGPVTDGSSGVYKSFNNKFCQDYFATEEMRRSYSLFVDYFFAGREPSALCKKFRIRCCPNSHGIVCVELWDTFKHYVQVDLLRELSIDA